MNGGPVNALTFDVEDWHQLVEWKLNGELPACSTHVLDQMSEILETLAVRKIRATFFVLGLVARAYPRLVREIRDAGHEVGCHGLSHTLVYRQTPAAFREETRAAKAALEDIIGDSVLGYRAAEFSITNASMWALDVLAETGFRYDSSIFPFEGRRYGVPNAPVAPYVVRTGSGEIVEFPMTVVEWRARRYPVGGGGYFRLLPYAVTRHAISRVNAAGRAAVTYFHPYEFSSARLVPRLTGASAYLKGSRYLLFHNVNRTRNRRRLERLLADHRFTTAAEVLQLG